MYFIKKNDIKKKIATLFFGHLIIVVLISSCAFLHYVFSPVSCVNLCIEHLYAYMLCQVRLDSECQKRNSLRFHSAQERHRGHASTHSLQTVSSV